MIVTQRRSIIGAIVVVALFSATTTSAAGFPERPVRLIIGTSPGGGTDAIGRLMSNSLASQWGQSVVVDNRPGADGMIGMDVVAKANADGHTLGINNANHTVRPLFNKQQPFDTVKSFTSIILLASAPDIILINPSNLAVKSLQELIAMAKAKPRQLNYGTAGPGTVPSLEMANFAQRVKIDMVEVHYKGSGPALVGLLTGEVQVGFAAVAGVLTHVKAGRLRPLASGSKVRHPLMPDVATIAEAATLPGFEAGNWYGILGPAGMSSGLTQKLYGDFMIMIKAPEIVDGLGKQGFLISTLNPAEFRQFMVNDMAKWTETVKALGTK